ncbi:MAG: 4Fe-4S binding protein [Dethiobacteria bacterium]|jgi:ferredoxin-type protein NapH|nr:4Fe-4S binding protein [Bacillota bacterium]
MIQKLRCFSQILFLILFVVLISKGNLQIWMVLILASVVLAALFGRFYCGWLCSIHTLMRPLEWLIEKIGWKRRAVPSWARSPILRYCILGAMIVVLVLTMVRGIKFPLLLILIPLALVVSSVFHSALWHRYLCPYGILFSLTARFAPLRVRVNQKNCNSCALCTRACPAEGVSIAREKETATIDPRYCLECFLCQDVCRRGAISYSKQAGGVKSSSTSFTPKL